MEKKRKKTVCKICGEPFLEHNYRVTLFEYGADPKKIYQRTEHTNHVDIHDDLLWMMDSNVTTVVNLDRVNSIVITDMREE